MHMQKFYDACAESTPSTAKCPTCKYPIAQCFCPHSVDPDEDSGERSDAELGE